MHSILDRLMGPLLTLSAVVMAGVLVHSEFFAAPDPPRRRSATYDPDWREGLPAGTLVGNPKAGVTVLVFSDLECPYCRAFHTTLTTVLAKHPEQVNYSFAHFPLSGHRHALEAARTVECAGRTGQFSQAIDFIFAHEDSLGLKPSRWFAEGAGVKDLEAWTACMADPVVPPSISAGLAQGEKMGLTGTPLVFLNGWRDPGTPIELEFLGAVDSLVAGKKPYAQFPASAIRSH